MFIVSDKTRKVYNVATDKCDKLLHRNMCKKYKGISNYIIRKINLKAKEVMIKYNLDDKTEPLAPHSPKITIKNHKDSFITNPTVRLICPSTSDIRKLNKMIFR